MSLHVFSPSFPTLEMEGTFQFTTIDFKRACHILSHGEWNSRLGEPGTPIAKNPKEPLIPVCWRTTWPGIRHLLNRYQFQAPNQVDRRGEGAGGYDTRMQVGDTGVIFRSANRDNDLKSRTLSPSDFHYIEVTRVK